MVYLFNSDVTLAKNEQVDSFGRLRVSTPMTIFDSQNRYELNSKFFSNLSDVAANTTVNYIQSQSSANLFVSTSDSAYVARESRYTFMYQPGKSLLNIDTFVMNSAKPNLVQRVGYYGQDNGYYIQLGNNTSSITNSSNIYMVERSNVTGVFTETLIAQPDWNTDKLDGTGASGVSLDLTKSHIFFADIEWLGAGTVRTGLVIDGSFIICHKFHHANITSTAYITTACLPIRYEIFNKGTTTGSSNLTQICSTVMSEGGYDPRQNLYVQSNALVTTATTTLTPLCSIRLAPGRLDAIAKFKQVVAAIGTTNDVAQWKIVLNGTLSGSNWRAHAASTNVQIDDTSTAISGGRDIECGFAQTGAPSTVLGVEFFEAQLGRNSFTQTSDVLSLCIIQCTTNPKVYWSIAWAEMI